jgi:heat shock protein HslJ
MESSGEHMPDRKFFLRFMSVLVTGALLVSSISPALAFPVSDKGQTGRIDTMVSGAGSSPLVYESPGGLGATRFFENTAAGLMTGNHTPEWLSSPGGDVSIENNPDPGSHLAILETNRGDNRSSWIHDPVERPSLNPGRDQIHSRWVTGEGVIRFINIEGDGFYGIITPSGDHYIPDNLPESLAVEGVQVMFRGMTNSPAINVRMWGTPLHLFSIDKTLPEISAKGRVIFIDLEGGFFGIITSAGEKYLPLNLPGQFKIDGTEVVFTAYKEADTATIFMWGIPIHLESVNGSGEPNRSIPGSWYLIRYLDGTSLRPVIPGTMITADFSDNGMVTGTAGCNRYFASYKVTGSLIEMGNVGSTKMYCSSPIGSMQQESTYLNLLGKVSAFSLRNGNLVLLDEKGNDILVFSKSATG